MKTSFTIFLLFVTTISFAQFGAAGFFDLSYGTIAEPFIDATSEAFENPEIQLNESGIGIGGSAKIFARKISFGGGGGVVFINSDSEIVDMNVGHGYGTVGYTFSATETLVVNASVRLGGFGNTMRVNLLDDLPLSFGDRLVEKPEQYFAGGFMYGAEVDVLSMFPQVPGLIVGLSGYFSAPINFLTWKDNDGEAVTGVEQGEYTHFGVSLKIGVGKINN